MTSGTPRFLAACGMLIGRLPNSRFKLLHIFWIVITVLMATIIILAFVKSLLQLLAFAVVVLFLTSQVLA
ncbi:MAG: divalent metal cation transporter, partial [Planctomycetota bacterium]|nr:divalent metal cation transporter [Planctomycetota bacterium]